MGSDGMDTGSDRGTYEFSEPDREVFRGLAASASFVGVCSMLFGALLGAFALGALATGFVGAGAGIFAVAAACLLTAWWTVSAGRSLSSLVATRGNDVGHLMKAAAQLERLFGFARVAVVVLALAAAAAAGVVFWCAMSPAKAGGDGPGRCISLWP